MKAPESMRGVSRSADAAGGIPVYRVQDPSALTQLYGWMKYKNSEGLTLLRGQSQVYPGMLPSALRNAKGKVSSGTESEALAVPMSQYLKAISGEPCSCPRSYLKFGQRHQCVHVVKQSTRKDVPLVQGTYRAAIEPLLQHYGVSTRWIDVVDNVWVALWFACHEEIRAGRHAYHLRRTPKDESNAYLAIFGTPAVNTTGVPGYWIGSNCRVVDLRRSVPSIYLRPHAQHGLLIASRALGEGSGDLAHLVDSYIEIDLALALEWLGRGAMVSPHVLFPPSGLDDGFRRLLDFAPPPPPELGSIVLYGPGY